MVGFDYRKALGLCPAVPLLLDSAWELYRKMSSLVAKANPE